MLLNSLFEETPGILLTSDSIAPPESETIELEIRGSILDRVVVLILVFCIVFYFL